MININFFEKKETNILPYIVTGGFFLLLILMGIYFFLMRVHLQEATADKEEWINAHSEEVVLSKQMNRYEQQYEETMDLQEELKAEQYPMNKLAKEIAASVPDELTRISTFQLLNPNQLTLTLENTDAILAQQIVENIENLPYVTELQLLYAESQGEADSQLRFELTVSLNEELIVEEESE